MYRIKLTKQAVKSFDQLMRSQPKMGRRVAQALDFLSTNPDRGISLRGNLKGLYKYRIGSYRIIYQIKRSILVIMVIDIGHRRDIYR